MNITIPHHRVSFASQPPLADDKPVEAKVNEQKTGEPPTSEKRLETLETSMANMEEALNKLVSLQTNTTTETTTKDRVELPPPTKADKPDKKTGQQHKASKGLFKKRYPHVDFIKRPFAFMAGKRLRQGIKDVKQYYLGLSEGDKIKSILGLGAYLILETFTATFTLGIYQLAQLYFPDLIYSSLARAFYDSVMTQYSDNRAEKKANQPEKTESTKVDKTEKTDDSKKAN